MSNSSLVNYTKLSPNKTAPRNHKIDTITIHCIVGQWTAKQGCDYFAQSSAKSSPNYVVGKDGSIGLSVDEKDRSWCSSNATNDHRAITIEVASDTIHPYKVTDAAYNALIKLLVDICKRNDISKLVWSTNKTDRINHKNGCNMTVHRDFANKVCPGDYLYNKHGEIAEEVNKQLGSSTNASSTVFAPYKVEINTAVLNVRSGAGTSYKITTTVKKGQVYTIVDEDNGWGKLKSGAGWIKLSYTKKI